jgi:hypothetical protein
VADRNGESPEKTGRGYMLDRTAAMLFRESVSHISNISIELGAALCDVMNHCGGPSPASERDLDQFMQHVWSRRSTFFQGAPFDGPAQGHNALWKLFGTDVRTPIAPESSWVLSLLDSQSRDDETDY